MNAPNLDAHTFQVNGATVTLARRTNRHAMITDRIQLELSAAGDDAAAVGYQRLFAKMVAQTTTIEGDLGLELPAPTAAPEDLRSAYETFLDADGSIGDAFYSALNTVNALYGPRAFLPPEHLSDEERKNMLSAAASGATPDDSSSDDS